MNHRLGRAALWVAAGFLMGAAALAGGQGEEDLRENLIELERLSAELRALDAGRAGLPAPNEQGLEFDLVPLTDLAGGVPDFRRPRRLGALSTTFGGATEEAPQPFGTIEEIVELVRTRVRSDAWETGSQIQIFGRAIVLFARPDVNRAVRAFLDKELRPAARRTVNLQFEIVEVPEPLAAALAAATGGEIDALLRGKLDEAIAAGKAQRRFGGRVLALSRQQVVLWHGAEAAALAGADLEVAQRAEAADPFVDVDLLGTILQARSTAVGDRVRVQLSLDHGTGDAPVRTSETEDAGTLQMPARTLVPVEADLWTGNDRWAVAGGAVATGGKRIFVLVRPTLTGGA